MIFFYTLVSNNSAFPDELTYMTEERIHSITFSESDVIEIVTALDVNEAHGNDNISVRMIQLGWGKPTVVFPNIFLSETG